jgi:hypothetical protein
VRVLGPQPVQRVRKVYRFKGLKLVGTILILAVVLQIIIVIGQNLFLRTTTAGPGIVEHEFPVDMLILRNETVLTAPMAGRVNLAVSAGSRVRRGDLLFEVMDPRFEAQLDIAQRQELIEYWRRIAEVNRVLKGIKEEIRIYKSKQSGIGQRHIRSIDKMDMQKEILRLQAEFLQLTHKKNSLLDSIHGLDSRDYVSHYRCIFADEAGFFWPALDGGEAFPNGELYVPKLQDLERKYHTVSPVLDKEVQKDQPLGKLITSWDVTLVTAVEETEINLRPKEMQHCRFVLADGREFVLEFLQKLPAPRGEFWLFHESSLDPEILKNRKIRGLLITHRTFGTRVPVTSLKKEGKRWFIMVSKKGKRVNLPIQVIDSDDVWAIVKGIDEGTVVLYH